MASSRQMRRSRIPSPMNTATHNHATVKNELHAGIQTDSLLGEWVEPALRTPAPSFEDYKGLERHGVLEHMAPLGTLPGQKVKARVRQHETSRRAIHLKNGEARAAREEVNTPEPPPPVTVRRSEPRKLDPSFKMSSSRERDEDEDYDPRGITRTTPAKALSPMQASKRRPSTSRPASGNAKLKEVVEQAAKRSAEMGSPDLGLAIKRLYDESLQKQSLADLLNAVLSQKQTPEQVAEFQQYVKAARKQIRHGDNPGKRSSFTEAVSKSPAKNGRTSVTRQSGNLNDPPNAPRLRHLSSNSNMQTSRPQPNIMVVNGSPSKGERPSKRVKRSASASSDSSLSSLDSAVEDFAPENVESTLSMNANNQPPSQMVTSSRGPRLGSFSTTKHYDPSKKAIATFDPTNEADADHAARRRRLQQGFHDFVVNESGIRTGPSSLKQPQTTPPVSVLSQRTHSRLRNGTVHRNTRYDDEALDSPTSSQGDLLVPPPPGASRGGTPNQLGRPPKAVKKAARIKMSPVKKRNGVTAGIARGGDADGVSIGVGGRTDDNHDHENADVCSACSGSGQLLCCDGCDRAFHFTCLDPPMDPNSPPDGEWHCYDCMKKRAGLERKERGVFMYLGTDVNGKNPSAFILPHMVRDFFDGVKTGEEGEYEEISIVKANKSRSSHEETSYNLRLKDGKDNSILCFRCSKSALGGREILGCDFCNLSWHLDCLEPPLASGPSKKTLMAKTRPAWMCPNHLDAELAQLDPPVVQTVKKSGSIKPVSGRPYHVRRPKNAKIIDIGLRRGFRNNGLIEIENELSEEEIEIEKETNGAIYRVQESGIKLDFIDRIKRARLAASLEKSPTVSRSISIQTIPTLSPTTIVRQANLDNRPFAERKAALNLAQMAESDSSLDANAVRNLISTLTAEAPTEVEDLVTAAENENARLTAQLLTEQEKEDLKTLIDLAQRRLNGGS